jgi:hypothetical protein
MPDDDSILNIPLSDMRGFIKDKHSLMCLRQITLKSSICATPPETTVVTSGHFFDHEMRLEPRCFLDRQVLLMDR